MQKVQIKIKGFEHEIVDMTAKKIITLVKAKKEQYTGPVPLPTRREVFTILRSVHVNKKSREQFEQRTHQRLITLINPSKDLLESLKLTEIPYGVKLSIK